MDNRSIDLHTHSTESDGTDTPEQLILLAKQAGINAIALTDHDTVSGIAKAKEAALFYNIELISGVELSCDHKGTEIHLLGYFVDETDASFLVQLNNYRTSREKRNEKMYDMLRHAGFDITLANVKERFKDAVLTRAHIARYLLETKQIKSMDVAFNQYIGDGCVCYVTREKLHPKDAISLIHQAKGIAVLAHPLSYGLSSVQLESLISDWAIHGLDGLESIYSTYATAQEHQLKHLAKQHSLVITGGSDYHGLNKKNIQIGKGTGHLYIPYSVLEHMKAHTKERNYGL